MRADTLPGLTVLAVSRRHMPTTAAQLEPQVPLAAPAVEPVTGDVYRLLVTGSRWWSDPNPIEVKLLRIASDLWAARPDATLVVVHGDCPPRGNGTPGVDQIAKRWALVREKAGLPVREESHPADWENLGKVAGFLRNADMVARGADRCLAWMLTCTKPGPCRMFGQLLQPGHGSHGATHCAALAVMAGIPAETSLRRPG